MGFISLRGGIRIMPGDSLSARIYPRIRFVAASADLRLGTHISKSKLSQQ